MPAADGARSVDKDATEHPLVSVTIEMDRLDDPIRGLVLAATEPAQRFRGWTGLLAVLQATVVRSRR
jgi:hypothetical protein